MLKIIRYIEFNSLEPAKALVCSYRSLVNKMIGKNTANHWDWLPLELVHFFLVVAFVDWNTDDADIKFSIYWPSTWFSERNFKFSSFTPSTRCDKSEIKQVSNRLSYENWPKSGMFYRPACFEARALVKSIVPFLLVHLDWCQVPGWSWIHHYCTYSATNRSILPGWCCHLNPRLCLKIP